MSIIVGDSLRIVCKMRDSNNSMIQNRYFMRHIGAAPITDEDALSGLESLMSGLYEYLDAYMPTSLVPESIEVDKVYFANGKLVTLANVGIVDWSTWTGGESTGERLPEGVAAVVNFSTVIPRTQGRKFIGTLVEGANDGGNVGSGFLLGLINYAAPMLITQTIATENFVFGVMSPKAEGLTPFTGVFFPTVWGYQRRRKPGVGV